MKFFTHQANLGKHLVRGIQTGINAIDQANRIKTEVRAYNSQTILYNIEVVHENYTARRLEGTKNRHELEKDSAEAMKSSNVKEVRIKRFD